LREIYEEHGISMKKVMWDIPDTPPHLMEKRRKEYRMLKYDLEHCHNHKIPLFYLDEASFSARSHNKLAWSNKHKNIKIDF
jgi:hypothetical protein